MISESKGIFGEEDNSMEKTKLYILWTNADPITTDKMVLMYAQNSLLKGWWKEVTLIIWGAPAKLVAEDPMIQEKLRLAMHAGVLVSACKACADQLSVTSTLESVGIEVKYWGQGLTDILKENETLLTI